MSQLPSPSDGALVEYYLRGDLESFEVLYRRFFPRLVRLCARVGAKGEAEDLAQETLLRARAVLPSFDTARPLWPWLKAIATRLAIDRGRRAAREIPVAFFAEDAVVDPGSSRVEERALLIEAMRNLTPAHRTVLRLRYLEDWSSEQAATFLGLTSTAFKQLMYRARGRLQAEYRRLSGPLAGILLPLRRLRHWMEVQVSRARRGADRAAPYSVAAGDAGVIAGLLALMLIGGGAPSPSLERELRAKSEASVSDGGPAAVSKSWGASARSPRQEPLSLPDSGPRAFAAGSDTGTRRIDEAARSVVDEMTNPAAGVDEPEDTQVLSLAVSPSRSDDSAFAVGRPACQRDVCPVVLFGSTDGGASWVRRAGAGMIADRLLLPPAFGEGDERIFAMGVTGLQVSHDQGESFGPATLGAEAPVSGPFAISPAFNSGDPSILIGAEGLVRFRDDVKMIEPMPTTAFPSNFKPAYSPDYLRDSVIFLGGVQVDPGTGTATSTVYRCANTLCSGIVLAEQPYTPEMRVPADHTSTGRVYAFTEEGVFVSRDHGGSFAPTGAGWVSGMLADLAVGDGGELFAAVWPRHDSETGGLYRSSDEGGSWQRVGDPLLDGGVRNVVLEGSRILVTLATEGVACSADGGTTWSSRCPA